ncbi:MAG TPA: DUF202 domain-containing protein [Bacteroidales bacterium]|nr:DUF202 domain-containing protein [Bacteroidales bacterium]
MKEPKDKNLFDKSREHLAIERTFLAWIRTSIALMGFGFVIVRFGLFLKQLALLFNPAEYPSQVHSSEVGVVMVAIGVLLAFMAFIQYRRHEIQLRSNSYYPSSLLLLFTTLVLIIGGVLLIFYLLSTI